MGFIQNGEQQVKRSLPFLPIPPPAFPSSWQERRWREPQRRSSRWTWSGPHRTGQWQRSGTQCSPGDDGDVDDDGDAGDAGDAGDDINDDDGDIDDGDDDHDIDVDDDYEDNSAHRLREDILLLLTKAEPGLGDVAAHSNHAT